MPKSALTTIALGPFNGLTDTINPSSPQPGKLRNMRNLVLSGLGKLSVRNGSALTLTLKDDAAFATVTSVLYVGTYMDGAIAIAHSTVTNKVYLYRMPATMDGWYDATGALTSNATPRPCAVLWTSVTAPPDVSVAEGLGTLYIAQTSAIDVSGLYFRTQTVTFTVAGVPTVADLAANGTGGSAGADFAYFTLVCSFHQHVWGWGYGSGAVAGYTSFRPELGKFSQPSFGAFQTADSIVFGDKVRALRERPIGAAVAGNAMFVGASKYLFRVTGYGRDSWFIETMDQKYGMTGPKAFVAVGNVLYYWTSRGLCRCADGGVPQPLWDAIVTAVGTVANESKIVLGFDKDTDQVLVTYDTGSGVRTLCAFDTRRDDYASVDGDIGLVINCAGIVEPIYQSTVTPPAPPAAPTISSTSVLSDTSANFTWAESDPLAQIEVSMRVQGTTVYTVLTTAAAGAVSYIATGLAAGTAYEWRVRSTKSGVFSSYVGPVAASQFTTTGTSSGGGGGSPPAAPTFTLANQAAVGHTTVLLGWANADTTLQTQIFFSSNGTTFFQLSTAGAGVASKTVDTGGYGTFYFYLRHITANGTAGAASAVLSADVTRFA